MRVPLKNIAPTLTVELTGGEDWLMRIYADFPVVDSAVAMPRLAGRLSLHLDEAGTVQVQGRLNYAPYVPCSRCDRPIEMPLGLSIDARFLPAMLNPAHDPETRREHNLSKAELDAYYIEDGQVDLESLINDAIHGEIPSQVLPATEDGSSCRVCHTDLRKSKVYGPDDADEPTSPFAGLRDIKL